MKWKPVAILTLTSMLAGGVPVFAADAQPQPVQVVVNGQAQQWTFMPQWVNGQVFVPADQLAKAFGATLKQDDGAKTLTLSKGSQTVTLTVGSSMAWRGGSQVQLPAAPMALNGSILIPPNPVAQWLGGDSEWIDGTKTLVLSTRGAITSGVSPDATNVPLTYEKALELAYANSYKVKNALEDITRTSKVLDKVSDNVEFVPARGGDTTTTQIYAGYTQASIAHQMSFRAYTMAQDVVTYAVKQAYNGILQAEAQQQAAEAALKNAQVQANIATVGHQYGTVSDIQWQQAMQGLQAAKAGLEAANKAVTDAYQRLNSLTGLPTDAKYQVVDQPQVDDLKNVDPEAQVARVTSDSPAIWQAEQQVNLAKLQLDLYTFNDKMNPDPYEAKQIDVQKAANTVQDLQDQLSRAVRSAYNGLLELRDQYQSLQSQLAAAEQSLKLAQIQYQYGAGIQADVVAAQAKVDQLKQQLANTAAQFDNLKMVFEKPWVAGGSGSTSGTSSGGSAG
ncbi:TolC family protein [Kyrpidia sp.]|uniref:stalk domain-containing protein n=1 Tax=Kyrpidia sp. TaxID=2073077 RepID=UPI002589F6AA|nr:TolC family protein [Kyrpidia sp.]MCL6576975.1 TolC family protein [Kyrpidia sp.]